MGVVTVINALCWCPGSVNADATKCAGVGGAPGSAAPRFFAFEQGGPFQPRPAAARVRWRLVGEEEGAIYQKKWQAFPVLPLLTNDLRIALRCTASNETPQS